MTHYKLTLRGVALHYYPMEDRYGWGPISSTTGRAGIVAEWAFRDEVQAFIDRHQVFTTGAVIEFA